MTTHHPPLETLRVFEACARLGSYSRAAEDLGLSQSAVSARIRTLEADLGVVLFEQTRPKLKLSAIGKKFSAEISQALAAIRAAIERIDDPAGRRLKLSVIPTFASRWLAPKLARWDAWPNAIPVELDIGLPLPPIGKGHCDAAIRIGRGHWPGLAALLLMPVSMTPMMSPALHHALGSPRTAEELLDAPLLPCELWSNWFRDAGLPPPAAVSRKAPISTPDAQAEAALAGDGIALLSPVLFRPQLTNSSLIAPIAHVMSGPDGYYLVHKTSHRREQITTLYHWLISESEKDR